MGYDELGSDVAHDFAWLKVRATRSLASTGLAEAPQWYVGPELNLAHQFYPERATLGALSFALQYRFGSDEARWRPWLGGSIGPALTDVGLPDCSIAFLVLSQLGGGLEWRPTPGAGWHLLLEVAALHGSNADLKTPNGGINALLCTLGSAWDW